jgi:hypothetical protein
MLKESAGMFSAAGIGTGWAGKSFIVLKALSRSA